MAFAARHDFTFPYAIDTTQEVSRVKAIPVLPTHSQFLDFRRTQANLPKDCTNRRCRLRRGFPQALRAFIRLLAFAAMNDAGAVAFGAWPHVKSVSDVVATAIVTPKFRLS
jgi:hypothetical protein